MDEHISIGKNAGLIDAGEDSISIGKNAGPIGQPSNSIVINAPGNVLHP